VRTNAIKACIAAHLQNTEQEETWGRISSDQMKIFALQEFKPAILTAQTMTRTLATERQRMFNTMENEFNAQRRTYIPGMVRVSTK
jgi:hypothetical protein